MGDKFNTIAGWMLFAGIVALGSTIAAGKYFNDEPPEVPGYPIAGVVEAGEGGAADAGPPFETLLASADPAKGAEVFKKCTACHTIAKGAPDGTGPNLWNVVGENHGHEAGFAYSAALKGVPGPWTFDALNEWLTSPRKYAPGTKMTFAGLSKPGGSGERHRLSQPEQRQPQVPAGRPRPGCRDTGRHRRQRPPLRPKRMARSRWTRPRTRSIQPRSTRPCRKRSSRRST